MATLTWLGSWGWQFAGQTFVFLALGLWVAARLDRTPARAHAVAVLALGGSLLTPLLSAGVSELGYGAFHAPPPATVYHVAGDRSGTEADLGTWLVAGWAVGSLSLLAGLGLSHARGRRLVNRTEPVTDPRMLAALSAAGRSLGLSGLPWLRSSPEVPSPMLWGWGGGPAVIVPDDWAAPGDLDWEAVFVHELAHLRRNDHLTRLFADIVVAHLFWNPAVWWVRERMDRACEFACDDWVLRTGRSPAGFAQALLALRRESIASALQAPALLGRRRVLKDRVLRLLQLSAPPQRCGGLWTAASVFATAGMALGLAVAQASPRPVPDDPSGAALVPARD